MSLRVSPNRLRATLSFVTPAAAISALQPVASITYQRIRATVLVTGEDVGVQLFDPMFALDQISFGVGKKLTDSALLTDAISLLFFSGSELDGAELNGVELNG